MKLQHLKNAVTSKVGRQILTTKKHSPTILFVGGVVGVVTSAVLASRATLKLEAVLSEDELIRHKVSTLEHRDYTEEDRIKDLYKLKMRTAGKVARLYAPSVAVGVISIAALTGSHVVLSRRNTAVLAAYSALDKGFKEYRQRVVDEYGEDKDLEFRHGTETRTELVVGEDGEAKTIEHKVVSGKFPSVYARFFDETSASWSREPEYNLMFLNCQQNYMNDRLRARGHVFLNEVYDALGIPRSKAGAVVGWVLGKDGDNYIDFGIYDETKERARAFVQGQENSILLDFNVDGVIYDLIGD